MEKHFSPRRSRLAYGISLAAILCEQPVFAQDTAEDVSPEVEEVVVTGRYAVNENLDTATGLGLSVQDTPQSVSIMTFERIEDQGLDSLTDAVLNAPGISAKLGDSSRYFFSSRGFSIDNYQIDGVPMLWEGGGDAGETQTDLSIYERVEVVRGATGLLTGVGEPSASLNLVHKAATAHELTGRVSASWNTYGITADVATPLNSSGSVRGRAVVKYQEGDSHTDYLKNKTSVFYATLDADLTDITLLRVGASYQDNDPKGSTWGGLPSWYADGSRTDLPRSSTIGADWTHRASTNENYFVHLTQQIAASWEARFFVNVAKNDSDQNLLYLYGYPDETTGLGMGGSPYNALTERHQTVAGVQLTGEFSLFGQEHEVVTGYQNSRQTFTNKTADPLSYPEVGNFYEWDGSYPEPGWSSTYNVINDQETKQSGFYAATRLNLTDTVKLILGGRVSDTEQTGYYYGTIDYGDTGVFTPYAGLLVDIHPEHTGYASFTEIFKPQDEMDSGGSLLDPVRGKSYELGLKSRFLNGNLQTTLAVFRTDQDDLAQAAGTVVENGAPRTYYEAADGTTAEGIELEVVGEVLPGLDITFSATSFEAEDSRGADINTDQPREMIKLFATYHFPGAWEKLTVGGGINWEGSNYTQTYNYLTDYPERLSQDEYSLVNLMARYDISPELDVQLNIDNLLDETCYSQIGFYDQLAYGEPRNFTLRLNYQF